MVAADGRVDRVVLLARPLFSEASLDLHAAVMVVSAADDTELAGNQIAKLTERLPGDASSSVAGGHYVFMRPCTDAEGEAAPAICTEPAGTDRIDVNTALVTAIVDFADVA